MYQNEVSLELKQEQICKRSEKNRLKPTQLSNFNHKILFFFMNFGPFQVPICEINTR